MHCSCCKANSHIQQMINPLKLFKKFKTVRLLHKCGTSVTSKNSSMLKTAKKKHIVIIYYIKANIVVF